MSSYPRGYQRWIIATKARGEVPDKNLVLFATRYRFAGQLNGIELLNCSGETEETYLLALRISLAYSALEQLEEALSEKRIAVKSIPLANAFRSASLKRFRGFLVEHSGPNLRNRLANVIASSNSSDMRSVIEALRHTMFHGSFNPSVAGLKSVSSRSFLNSLDHHLFLHMENLANPAFIESPFR